jgi:hypothetical protein
MSGLQIYLAGLATTQLFVKVIFSKKLTIDVALISPHPEVLKPRFFHFYRIIHIAQIDEDRGFHN